MYQALYPDQAHPDVAMFLNNVGGAYQALGDAKTGLKYHQQALDMSKMIYDEGSEKIKIYQENVKRLENETGSCLIL